MNQKEIILPFDVYTDIEIKENLLTIWGYSSEREFKVVSESYNLQEFDKNKDIIIKSVQGGFRCGSIFPINLDYLHSYVCIGKWILKKEGHMLKLQGYTKRKHRYCEIELLKEYLEIHGKYELLGIIVRIIYHCFFYKVKSEKDTIVLFDRKDRAGDNAEALFRYLNEKHKGERTYYFAIKRTSADWKRLKKIGKVIPHGGIKYMRLFWGKALLVSSYADKPVWAPFGAKAMDTYRDLVYGQRIVFLQHGVIKDDLSKLYNATLEPICMFVATTKAEYASLLGQNYGFIEGQVRLTGLPRYDLLENNPQRYITFMPTWRVEVKRYINDEGKIEETEYFKIMKKLFMEPEIVDLVIKYDYKIRIMLHPMLRELTHMLKPKIDSRVIFLPYYTKYSDIFSESDLIITDYSSVAFDFAYLRKPIIYYQEDYTSFFSGEHNYIEGYYSYENDGFGEVVKSKKELLVVLEEYLKTDCKLKPKYKKRIENTFIFADRNNCKRVYEELNRIFDNI